MSPRTPLVVPVPGQGAEDVVVATSGPYAGSVFTGTDDGTIWRISHDGARVDRVAETAGRPLGIETDADGDLLVCDAYRGLLRVAPGSGAIERLTDAVEGRPMLFCNNASIAGDGTIWFTDSSTRYGIDRWKADMAEGVATGRLLRRDPHGGVTVPLDGLAFANGVALAADESFVAVAETARRTVVRLWLTGERAGTRDLLADDLPGYPDNIARGSDGLVWVTIASPTDPVLERIRRGPMWLRRGATRVVPERLQPAPKRTVRVQAYADDGRLVHDVEADAGGYHMVTGVREHDGRVWLGSLHEPAVAVLDL